MGRYTTGERTACSSVQLPTTKRAWFLEIALFMIIRGWSLRPRVYSLPVLSSFVSGTCKHERGRRGASGNSAHWMDHLACRILHQMGRIESTSPIRAAVRSRRATLASHECSNRRWGRMPKQNVAPASADNWVVERQDASRRVHGHAYYGWRPCSCGSPTLVARQRRCTRNPPLTHTSLRVSSGRI